MDSGMGWVIGGLLAVLAIALVIAGATGHASQLFTGITGKSTAGAAASSSGVGPIGANLTADQAVSNALAGLAQASPATSTTPPSASPYATLGGLQGTVV